MFKLAKQSLPASKARGVPSKQSLQPQEGKQACKVSTIGKQWRRASAAGRQVEQQPGGRSRHEPAGPG